MPRTVKLCLMGFGNVGQAFVHLAERKKNQLEKDYGVNFIVTAIATGRHGRAINPEGIDTEKAIALYQKGQSLVS
jgi:homoserine dehydrogenase